MKKNDYLTKEDLQQSIDTVLSAVNTFAEHMENRFNTLENRFDGLENRFDGLENRFDGLDQRLTNVESIIQNKIVTKDYLDEKLMDLRGDLIVMIRKEDNKLLKLVETVENRKLISHQESQIIMSMEPFAKI